MSAKTIIDNCRTSRSETGYACINTKEVAVLIRARLKREFPGVKFSVRKTGYNSISIYWTDGPNGNAVDFVTQQYSFGGFDGMIDMAYYSDNWLLPDGSMETAVCRGTVGSRGTVPAFASDCPIPGAVMVSGGPQNVFTQRTQSQEEQRRIGRIVAEYYGWSIDHDKDYGCQYTPDGDNFSREIWRFEQSGRLEEIENPPVKVGLDWRPKVNAE